MQECHYESWRGFAEAIEQLVAFLRWAACCKVGHGDFAQAVAQHQHTAARPGVEEVVD